MGTTMNPTNRQHGPAGGEFTIGGCRVRGDVIAPGLYVTATPIGRLSDITVRALEVLAGVERIYCEDTRVSGKLLKHYGISTPLGSYHDHSAAPARNSILERLGAGAAVALISDAGTPLVSDPGMKLVRAARERDLDVFAVPGPSSVLAALSVSGLPSDQFFFAGFLPQKAAQRRTRIGRLGDMPGTIILFESARRLAAMLADLEQVLGNRDVVIARELTKRYEEVFGGGIGTVRTAVTNRPSLKGEIVVLVAPRVSAPPPDEGEIDRLLGDALTRLATADAAAEVARQTGLARRRLYQRALELGRGK